MLALRTTCSITELDVLSAQYAVVLFVELKRGGGAGEKDSLSSSITTVWYVSKTSSKKTRQTLPKIDAKKFPQNCGTHSLPFPTSTVWEIEVMLNNQLKCYRGVGGHEGHELHCLAWDLTLSGSGSVTCLRRWRILLQHPKAAGVKKLLSCSIFIYFDSIHKTTNNQNIKINLHGWWCK